MYIHIKNKLSILPFVFETDGAELIENWEAKDLHIEKAKFFLLELDNGSKIWLNESFILPLYINGKYVEKRVEELVDLKTFEDVKVLQYHTNTGMDFETKNKVVKELFKDFSFKFINVKKIKLIGEENSIRVDELIKKFILINQILILLPNVKSISSLRDKELSKLREKIEMGEIENKEDILLHVDQLTRLLKLEKTAEEKAKAEKYN